VIAAQAMENNTWSSFVLPVSYQCFSSFPANTCQLCFLPFENFEIMFVVGGASFFRCSSWYLSFECLLIRTFSIPVMLLFEKVTVKSISLIIGFIFCFILSVFLLSVYDGVVQ